MPNHKIRIISRNDCPTRYTSKLDLHRVKKWGGDTNIVSLPVTVVCFPVGAVGSVTNKHAGRFVVTIALSPVKHMCQIVYQEKYINQSTRTVVEVIIYHNKALVNRYATSCHVLLPVVA